MTQSTAELRLELQEAEKGEMAARHMHKRASRNGKAPSSKDAKKWQLILARATKKRKGIERKLRVAELAREAEHMPAPYTPTSLNRFFLDLVRNKEIPQGDASRRLERHVRVSGQGDRRVSGTTQGQGFAAPDFYAEAWADVPRTAAPVFSALPKLPLPAFGLDAYVPAWTTGSEAGVQTKTSGVNDTLPQGDAVAVASEQVTSHLVTVAMDWQVDRQPLERARPGWEISFGRDIAAAVYEKLDDQLINGTGSNQQHYGLLNVPNAGTYDATAATDAQTQLRALAEAAASMYSSRHALPTHAVMSPARALSLYSGLSGTGGAPLVPQGSLPSPGVGADADWPMGMLIPGVGVLVTDKISDADVVLWRASDAFIAVDANPLVFDYEERDSSALSLHLIGFLYSQAFLHRVPSSVMIVQNIPAVSW